MVFCAKSLKTFVQPHSLRLVAAIITLQLMVQGVNACPFFSFTFSREGIVYPRPGKHFSISNNNSMIQGPSASGLCESEVTLLLTR